MAKYKQDGYRQEIINYAKMAKFAYTSDQNILPSGFELYRTSSDYGLSNAGYNGAALVNFATKEIIIASEGTDVGQKGIVDMFYDLYNDTQLSFNFLPSQYKYGCKPFVENVLGEFGKNGIKDYKVTFVGHSLGAVISELGNYHFSKTVDNCSAVVFDSPGAKPIIQANFDNKFKFTDNCTAFNSTKNVINGLHQCSGEVVYIGADKDFHIYNPLTVLATTGKSHSLDGIIEKLNFTDMVPEANWSSGIVTTLVTGYHPYNVTGEVVYQGVTEGEFSDEVCDDFILDFTEKQSVQSDCRELVSGDLHPTYEVVAS
jgi:hypothetical protein